MVVGIGASAGGIEALSRLIRELPRDTGIAFVVVQHLDPTHSSMLTEILARSSSIPIREIAQGVAVEPDHVYVIPPGKDLVLADDRLALEPRAEGRGTHRPIDHFLRSLAEQRGHRSIGVVLSGTGNDGSIGLEEIKAAGGITFAQDASASHDAMPRNAIASGTVDFVLPPEEIANELAHIGRHPYVAAPLPTGNELPADEPAFNQIIEMLRKGAGVDFGHYKRNTLQRRIARRVVLHKLRSMKDYVRLLETDAGEAAALYQDVLINVTSFFRDPDAYDALKRDVFPRLIADRNPREPLRVWVMGCASGEEAYSIAIAFREFAEQAGAERREIQIFATDVNGTNIERARAGVYPRQITESVSPERLRRFFTEVDGAYRICKPIRDLCVFARHDLLADPPFSRMDLVACRNVLIYLDGVLQQRVLPLMHYALRGQGMLWLGNSETIGTYRNLFEVADPKHKFYVKKGGAERPAVVMPRTARIPATVPLSSPRATDPPGAAAGEVQREADRLVLGRYGAPGVIVNRELDIVQFRGDTGAFLAPAPGRASLNLLKMLREGLLVPVRTALEKAKREHKPVRVDGLRIKGESGSREVALSVTPIAPGSENEACLLVLFEDSLQSAEQRARRIEQHARAELRRGGAPGDKGGPEGEVERLRAELAETRDYLQAVIEQQESANEELQSANEEVQSANEELQSINEELETSKEEIQSSNEELATVNEELQHRNAELAESNNDLNNLLGSVQMAIVMLGPDLRIRRFTPLAEKQLNLIPSDVGRPLSDIKTNLALDDLDALLLDVIENVRARERTLQDRRGVWYSLRVRPYRTPENRVEGVVLMLIDIDAVKRGELALVESEARFALLADDAPVLIWVDDLEGRQFVNRAHREFLGVGEEQLRGQKYLEFVHPDDRPQYAAAYQAAIGRRERFEFQSRLRRADGQWRWMHTVGMPRIASDGSLTGYVGSSYDVTELREAAETLREADRNKTDFLAVLAHELRNPLAAVHNAAYFVTHAPPDSPEKMHAKTVIERQTRVMVQMIDDLLDVTRLARGTIRLRRSSIDLRDAIHDAADASAHLRETAEQPLELDLPRQPVAVLGDRVRVSQILGNLLANASRYSANGRAIRVRLVLEPSAEASTGRWAVVSVTDQGIGLDPAMLKRVFEPFVQLARPGTSTTAGIGIGLALARELALLHGGTLEARSEGHDKGSEFVLRLPALEEGALAETGSKKSASQAADAARVIVVDDNPDAARTAAMLLELSGHTVKVADSARACEELLPQFEPHLVLIDIGMPEVDGLELARRLRKTKSGRAAYLVALTGFGSAEDQRRYNEHLTKPMDPDALPRLIVRARRGSRPRK